MGDSSHNYLRISRILKCLSEMGLERFNAAFVLHVLQEQSERDELDNTRIRNSMDKWYVPSLSLTSSVPRAEHGTARWANCIRNENERTFVGNAIQSVRSEEHVFTREMYRRVMICRQEYGELRWDVRPTQGLFLGPGEVDEPMERGEAGRRE